MIPYGRQSISNEDIEAVIAALKGDFLTTGPLVEKFEKELEKIVGAPCLVVSSGTAALHCAYAAIDLKPGDEVITPPITFIATQATATFFGASIIFADIQDDTGNIDPKAVEAVITKRTKAIVAVDYAGHPADLDELREIADKYEVFLIEDAAHSIGSQYKGRPVGSIADITTFSFFPTKNMTTAEGGAVASTNPELLLKARRFARQGMVRESQELQIKSEGPWHQEVQNFGLNYRLPDVLCALGLSQLSRLEEFKSAREKVFNHYTTHLKPIEEIGLPALRQYVNPMWHLYPIHVPAEVRKTLYLNLHKNNIGVQVNYLPAHQHPVFKSRLDIGENLKKSEKFYQTQLSLPMSASLTPKDLEHITRVLIEFFK